MIAKLLPQQHAAVGAGASSRGERRPHSLPPRRPHTLTQRHKRQAVQQHARSALPQLAEVG